MCDGYVGHVFIKSRVSNSEPPYRCDEPTIVRWFPVGTEPVWFGLAYLILAVCAGFFTHWTNAMLYVWLASGLYVGALIVVNPRRWPAMVLAATVADFAFNQIWDPWPIGRMILAHAGNTTSALFGAALVLHFVSPRPTLGSVRELIGVVLLGGVVGSIPSALIGGHIIQQMTPASPYWENVLGWYSSDLLGVVLVAPLVLVWQRGVERFTTWMRWQRILEFALLLGAVTAMTIAAFYFGWLRQTETLSLAYPFTIWAALRFGLRGSTIAILVTAMVAQTFTALGLGALGGSELTASQKAIEIMVSVGIFAIAALLPATVFTALKIAQGRERIRTTTMTLMATGENLSAILESIVTGVEAELRGARGRILLANEAGTHLVLGSAPHLPSFFNDAMPGTAIKPDSWVCGAAAYTNRRVVLEDLKTDPRTADTYELAERAGIRSCWSEPFCDSSGRLLGTLAVFFAQRRHPTSVDLESMESAARIAAIATERKQLEQQFLRAQRMEGIGTLAGGIAHDLNNALAPIVIGADILRDVPLDAGDRQVLANMEAGARLGANLVKQVLTFARGVEGSREILEVREIVGQIQMIAGNTFPKSINIETDLRCEGVRVEADRTQLEQVLLNLAVNARDAMPDGGRLTIRVDSRHIDAQQAGRHVGARTGQHALIEVADSGTGISPDVIHRIFEPFFTTKKVGQGTGLGLSTTLGIIRSHGGFIEVDSTLHKGSTFYVYLPACGAETSHQPLAASARAAGGQGELVLLVEDDQTVRDITRRALGQLGYRVISAEHGVEALVLVALHGSDIAVVVTDIIMPLMGGRELIQALQRSSPYLPIITVSGFDDQSGKIDTHDDLHLQKPYTVDGLANILTRVLQSKRG